MKMLTATVIAIVLAMSVFTVTAFAGGGQVQGDKGTGTVVQNGSCPFGVNTPP